MTDENQKRDDRKGPWRLLLVFIAVIGVIAVAVVIATSL